MARHVGPAQPQTLLTAAEMLVPSVVTSAVLFVAVGCHAPHFADTSVVNLAFFALLPTLLSVACVQDQVLLEPFKRAFMAVFRCGDPLDDGAEASAVTKALASARLELTKALTDRWQVRKSLAATASSPALAALHHATQRTPRVRQRREVLSSSHASSSSELLSASTSGKSLYDQVKENLTDHAFTTTRDAPIYFMDPTTGLFLRVNAQHKLVFTREPDAACLFHVTQGKTHHWGLLSAIYQRYVGQNFVGRVVVSSKKLQGWESFRVLERPSDDDSPSPKAKTIYLILCSSRFGKGMWLAKNQPTAALSASVGPPRPSARSRTSVPEAARDNIYLSKHFAHALALTYASDLSALEYLASDARPVRRSSSTSAQSSSPAVPLTSLAAPLPVVMQTAYLPPVNTVVRTQASVALPWLADNGAAASASSSSMSSLSSSSSAAKRFLELADKRMTEVQSTTVTRRTVRDALEVLGLSDAARSRAVQTATPSSDAPSDWHVHPLFGFVRKLSYRPAGADASVASTGPIDDVPLPSAVRTIAIDQYVSCVVSDKAMDTATVRVKLFGLSAPRTNGVSVEVVFELQDLADTTTGGPSPVNLPVLQLRCATGVVFARPTEFAALISKGVVQGVQHTCDLVLETLRDTRVSRSSSDAPAASVPTLATAVPPHMLAMDVVRGVLAAFDDAASLHSRVQSLPTQLPWHAYDEAFAAPGAEAPAATVVAPTAVPFFETAPQAFTLALDERLGSKVTPTLFFQSLLADASAFVYGHRSLSTRHADVDIGAWVPYTGPASSSSGTQAWVRLQTFAMSIDSSSAAVARVTDYQYHAFVEDERTGKSRLEFGSKLLAQELPGGEHYSVRVRPIAVVRTPPLTPSLSSLCRCLIDRSRRSCTLR